MNLMNLIYACLLWVIAIASVNGISWDENDCMWGADGVMRCPKTKTREPPQPRRPKEKVKVASDEGGFFGDLVNHVALVGAGEIVKGAVGMLF
jgi:hypothetical protein